jgi:hypothetical protein
MKRNLWRTGLLAFLICLLMGLPAPASAERQPLKLARVPVIVLSDEAPESAAEKVESRVDEALHIPLNGVLHAVEEIPSTDVERALQEVRDERSAAKQSTRLKDLMAPLAQKLGADLVVCPVIEDYHEWIYNGFGWFDDFGDDQLLETDVCVAIYGYVAFEGKPFHKAERRWYRDIYSPYETADYLLGEAADRAIDGTELVRRITQWKKKDTALAAGGVAPAVK